MVINKPQTATVIDSLSDGFRSVNQRLWLVLVPLLFNLYLWFGAPLSFSPLMQNLAALVRSMPTNPAADQGVLLPPEQIAELGTIDMRRPLALLNAIPTLTVYLVGAASPESGAAGMPMVQALPQQIDSRRADTVLVGGLGGALLAALLVNLLVLPLSAVFLTLLAEAVRQDRAPLATRLRRSAHAALALLGCAAVVAGVALAVGLPFLFLASLLLLVSPLIGGLLVSLLFFAWFWAQIYIGFAPEAIVVSGIGPLQALRASFTIVRRNLWGTLGLLALSALVTIGSGVIWYNLVGNSIGLGVAMLGSAYIGSGLLAARMAFYRERLRRWQAAVTPARSLG